MDIFKLTNDDGGVTYPFANATVPANNAVVHPGMVTHLAASQQSRGLYTHPFLHLYVCTNHYVGSDQAVGVHFCRWVLNKKKETRNHSPKEGNILRPIVMAL